MYIAKVSREFDISENDLNDFVHEFYYLFDGYMHKFNVNDIDEVPISYKLKVYAVYQLEELLHGLPADEGVDFLSISVSEFN